VISHHPEWGQVMLGFFRGELAKPTADEKQREALRDQLAAFSKGEPVRHFIADALHDDATPVASRLLLLEGVAAAPLDRLPGEWAPELARGLASDDERIVRQSLIAIRAFPADKKLGLDAPLLRVASDEKRSADVRVLAASVAAPRAERLDRPVFAFVLSCLAKDRPSLLRSTAAEALGRAKLDDAQRDELTRALPAAGPLELPRLLTAFDRPGNADLGIRLVAALDQSAGLKSLRADELNHVLEQYPPAVREAARPLLQRLAADSEKQKAHLAELEPLLATGDPSRGRELFFGNKAACSTCHTVQGRGGRVGPDLSKIASIRAGRDLLESVVYPSASFARGYEPVIVKTRDGDVQSGIVARETADAVYLYNAQRVETRIGRSEIADLRPSPVSIMPEGLDAQLSRENMADLLAFLQSLK
jgi:putative heme-binding domain-containing protein